jgi:hypothetical protein
VADLQNEIEIAHSLKAFFGLHSCLFFEEILIMLLGFKDSRKPTIRIAVLSPISA